MKLTYITLLFLCSSAAFAQSGLPVLQAGTVNISGEVIIPEKLKKDSVWVWLTIPQPFTGENIRYKTLLNSNGHFELKVNTETNIGKCAITTDINMAHLVTIPLKNGQESKITFSYSDDGFIDKLKTSDNAGFTEEELIQSQDKFDEMDYYKAGEPFPLYDKPFSAYIDFINNALQKRRALLNKPSFLSERMKEIIFMDYTLRTYQSYALEYYNEMVRNYRNTNDKKAPDSSEIKKPGREYFSFLKDLDLNNPLYLYAYSYPDFTQDLLKNSTLDIPRIQDIPIPEWTKNVKEILGHPAGYDQGLFYNMLIGNTYGMQFQTEIKPLTVKQIENIKSYYKGGDMEKVLMRKNQEVMEKAGLKEALVVNNTPDVAPGELMDAIISRYKGKAIIVDFWATWCVPCIEAMKESVNLKKEFAGKDAVFVYLTDPSSPKKLWEMHIQGIGGEQYYLTSKEKRYLMDNFNFKAIPSYLVFDRKGVLKQQFTGYPGNEVMQKEIEAALDK